MDHYQKTLKMPDFSLRAEELYRLNKDRYFFEERVTGYYLQVSLFGRTREEGLAQARRLRALAVAGASFQDLVNTHSDDPALRRNKGRIEGVPAKDLEKPLADAAFALMSPGDITEPVETPTAFHLFQLEKKTPARQIPFEEVRDQIIESERQIWLGAATDRRVGELKNTPQTKVYEENVRSLLREFVPPEVKAGAGSKAP
jgi:parvulin-like peptidyl-prolyl isomerase